MATKRSSWFNVKLTALRTKKTCNKKILFKNVLPIFEATVLTVAVLTVFEALLVKSAET